MINRRIKAGTVDVSVVIRIVDSTDGTPETGVTSATAGLALEYRREGATSTAITEVDLTNLNDAHSDGGIKHIGNGYYRLDLPDAACATGVNGVLVHGTVTGMVVIGTYIELVADDPYTAGKINAPVVPYVIQKGATDKTLAVMAYDRATGTPKTGLTATGITGSYSRSRAARQSITVADLTNLTDAHSDGGFKEVDATNMPGVYRFDAPDAPFATGVDESWIYLKKDGVDFTPLQIGLVDYDPSAEGASTTDIANAVGALIVEGSITLIQSLRLNNAAQGGKASGMGGTSPAIRDLADTKNRIAATVDADGNRTAVTLDLS